MRHQNTEVEIWSMREWKNAGVDRKVKKCRSERYGKPTCQATEHKMSIFLILQSSIRRQRDGTHNNTRAR